MEYIPKTLTNLLKNLIDVAVLWSISEETEFRKMAEMERAFKKIEKAIFWIQEKNIIFRRTPHQLNPRT